VQHGENFVLPDVNEWISPAPLATRLLLGWKSGVLFKPVSGCRATPAFAPAMAGEWLRRKVM